MLLLTTFVVVAMSASAEEKEPVIIGFKDKISYRTIRQYRGQVTGMYDNCNVVTARMSERSMKMLERNRQIDYVEKDFSVSMSAQTLPYGVDYVDAEQVHSSYTGAGVKIAVLDTGIDYDHPDLDDNYVGGYDFVNDDSDPMDDEGHGTHVAGTIAAEDNSIGVIGVAPDASLYGVKVLNHLGDGSGSDIIAGIDWAVNNNMDIISMSLGSNYGSSALLAACNAADNAGIVVVAAAGNDGTLSGSGDSVDYPARYSSVIAVSSIDSVLNRQTRASSGPTVEICAPGVSIYSTTLGGSYGTKSGTSMATPHVSGVAALIIESDGSLSNDQVREKMTASAYDLGAAGRDNLFGYGMVLADDAIAYEVASDPETHIDSITMSYQTANRKYTIYTNVLVKDESGDPIEGATVTMTLSYSQNSQTVYTGDTGADGWVTFIRGPTRRRSTYTATITSVVKTNYTYNSGSNIESADNVAVS